jgi:hypothetical protein
MNPVTIFAALLVHDLEYVFRPQVSEMTFVPERFVLKIDDDDIPTNPNGIARSVSTAVARNTIMGRFWATLTSAK